MPTTWHMARYGPPNTTTPPPARHQGRPGVFFDWGPGPGGAGAAAAVAGFRSPANREIASRHQQLVCGSGLAVSFVDSDCEIAVIIRDMATTTDVPAGSLKKAVPSRIYHSSESTGHSGRDSICSPKNLESYLCETFLTCALRKKRLMRNILKVQYHKI
jgi:hypothetical protein